jgi:hypothetical protein
MPHPAKALLRGWRHQCENRTRLRYVGAGFLLTILFFTPFASFYMKERQLDRREQTLKRLYADLNGTVQMTEEIARRIEEKLGQQQQIMSSLQVYFEETNRLSAPVSPPIELPLEQAPSP